jgi:hypothetical protein
VYGFDNVTGTGRGGNDTANLYDSAGNDRLFVRDWGSYMTNTSATWRNTAQDFDNILCHSVNGGTDVADTWVVDYLFSLIGGWT